MVVLRTLEMWLISASLNVALSAYLTQGRGWRFRLGRVIRLPGTIAILGLLAIMSLLVTFIPDPGQVSWWQVILIGLASGVSNILGVGILLGVVRWTEATAARHYLEHKTRIPFGYTLVPAGTVTIHVTPINDGQGEPLPAIIEVMRAGTVYNPERLTGTAHRLQEGEQFSAFGYRKFQFRRPRQHTITVRDGQPAFLPA